MKYKIKADDNGVIIHCVSAEYTTNVEDTVEISCDFELHKQLDNYRFVDGKLMSLQDIEIQELKVKSQSFEEQVAEFNANVAYQLMMIQAQIEGGATNDVSKF